MNIDEKLDNIRYVQIELKKLRKDLADLPSWKEEKSLIEEQINSYGSINFDEIGYKTGGAIYGLDDLLINDREKVSILEGKINQAEYRYNRMKIHINKLSEDQQMVIYSRYINTNGENVSFEKISKIVKYSKMHVKRLHDSSLEKIADSMFRRVEIA